MHARRTPASQARGRRQGGGAPLPTQGADPSAQPADGATAAASRLSPLYTVLLTHVLHVLYVVHIINVR